MSKFPAKRGRPKKKSASKSKSPSKKIIIYDTEYTSWEGSLQRNWNKKYEYKELVQLSAIKLLITKNNISKLNEINLYIKPQINSILSKYFINLTKINQEKINNEGIFYEKALKKFYNFSKDNIKLYCWGSDLGNDSDVLLLNMKYYNITNIELYNWIKKYHFDIRFIFKKYNIDTINYNSGSIYKIIPNHVQYNSNIHNAKWDIESILLALKWLNNKYKNINSFLI